MGCAGSKDAPAFNPRSDASSKDKSNDANVTNSSTASANSVGLLKVPSGSSGAMQLFVEIDVDGTGAVDPAQVQSVLAKLGLDTTAAQAQKLVECFDGT